MFMLLIVLLILACFGGLFGVSRFGYGPSFSPLGLILLICVVLWYTGNLNCDRGFGGPYGRDRGAYHSRR